MSGNPDTEEKNRTRNCKLIDVAVAGKIRSQVETVLT